MRIEFWLLVMALRFGTKSFRFVPPLLGGKESEGIFALFWGLGNQRRLKATEPDHNRPVFEGCIGGRV